MSSASEASERIQFVLIARIPAPGVASFRSYEDAVLPLLEEHGGRLERRLRTDDARAEVHLLSFASRAGLERYRADARRQSQEHLLHASGASTELLAVRDV